MTFAVVSQAYNTSTGVSTPSGCVFDAQTFSSEWIDGPTPTWPGDENNGWEHCHITSYTNDQYAFTLASSTEAPSGGNSFAGMVVSVFPSTSSAIIDAANCREGQSGCTYNSSAHTLTFSVHPTTAGQTALVAVADYNGQPVTSVAFSNGTGGASSFTQCTTGCTVGSGTNRADQWINTNEPSGATTIIVTLGGGASQVDVAYLEEHPGGTVAQDVGGNVTTTGKASSCTGSGTYDCGYSVTTSGTFDLISAVFNSTNAINYCPASGNAFSTVSLVWNGGNDGGFCALLAGPGTYQPIATDNGTAASLSESTHAERIQ
jgi:hypothetical protein